ncbi:hypothetical protein [Bdellovibrio sp.]|jgi:hypothetical protein|uniref:hypothetical protein n=1 Tax=Bdellovibrio TaxID=958 RepID=UPI003221B401
MKMLLLTSVLVFGLAACSHKAHKHENCGCGGAKAEKSECSGKECGMKKESCGDCKESSESK